MAMDIKPEINPEKNLDIGLDMPTSAKSDINKEAGAKKGKKNKGAKAFVGIIIVIIVLLVVGFLVDKYTSLNLLGDIGLSSSSKTVKADMGYNKDSYYAVFLSNGQVYFGNITKTNDDFTILQDIYYLQVSNPLQQVPPTGAEQQPQLTLVKLGNELHGPQDYMKINNTQIIFFEELKDDGKVVEAIIQYRADNIE